MEQCGVFTSAFLVPAEMTAGPCLTASSADFVCPVPAVLICECTQIVSLGGSVTKTGLFVSVPRCKFVVQLFLTSVFIHPFVVQLPNFLLLSFLPLDLFFWVYVCFLEAALFKGLSGRAWKLTSVFRAASDLGTAL